MTWEDDLYAGSGGPFYIEDPPTENDGFPRFEYLFADEWPVDKISELMDYAQPHLIDLDDLGDPEKILPLKEYLADCPEVKNPHTFVGELWDWTWRRFEGLAEPESGDDYYSL